MSCPEPAWPGLAQEILDVSNVQSYTSPMMKNEHILSLLQTHVSSLIETTETRRRDSLDFHDVHIKGLVDVVNAAFEAGRNQGYGEGMEAAQDMAAAYNESYDK